MGHEPSGTAAMSEGISAINTVLDHIEAHLGEETEGEIYARLCGLSVYEFRRIFSFIVGVPVAEYVRRRRLSRAGEDIKAGAGSLQAIGARYGYAIASSFGRAFREYHGISPKEAKAADAVLHYYARPAFDLVVRGGVELSYTVERRAAFCIFGVRGFSSLADTVCCESVWHRFEAACPQIEDKTLYAAYQNGAGQVDCCVGYADGGVGEGRMEIPASDWACFSLPAGSGEADMNALYNRVLYTWLPGSRFCLREGMPNVEAFLPDGVTVVMIPVGDKEKA